MGILGEIGIDIGNKVGVASVNDKMGKRRCMNAPVQRYERLAMDGSERGRGTPKKH